MKQYNNVAGPCVPGKHCMIPALERLPEVARLIDRKQSFVIHVARQSGKTPALMALLSACLLSLSPMAPNALGGLATAVDWESLPISTGGNSAWKSVTTPSHDGVDAAQSGSIGASQTSWMQATMTGSALVSFWWNVSSEANYDKLSFSVDGTDVDSISGTAGTWRRHKALLTGHDNDTHTLCWTYAKDSGGNEGSDAGWVDEFEIHPYPTRKGYHVGFVGHDIPASSETSPLDHGDYFPANGCTGAFWDEQEDGTWICYVHGSDGYPHILQDVINIATPGDTILVWPGSYGPITINKKDIAIVAAGSRDETFINAKYNKRCVTFDGGSDRSFLSGFTLVQGYATFYGGGVFGGTLRNCVIAYCVSYEDGGGAFNSSLTDCSVLANGAANDGGGAYGCTLNRCELRGNRAVNYGGALANSTATGCLLARNYADRAGGADLSTLVNCTVADNRAITSHGGVWRCTVRNSIVVKNTAPIAANWGTADTRSTFSYCCASPVPPGAGNFNVAPGFVDFDNSNFHLANTSKCRDKGSKNLTKAPYDLAGLDRVMGSNIDVGCYEYATGVTPLDPADYDGDGVPDIGFYNPKTSTWFIRRTSDYSVRREKLGFAGVTIIPRDYDGDGIRDPAIYNPNSGYWQILQSTTGEVAVKKLGWKGIDLVDAADFDGDGCADPIIFNPASKTWQVLRSGNGVTDVVKNFGWAGIKLVCGDYDGDGRAELAFYSPTSGKWYIRWRDGKETSISLIVSDVVSGARVAPMDTDWDGMLNPCIFDPSNGWWIWYSLADKHIYWRKFGDSTVTPHSFDWDGDGMPDTMGFYSPYRAGFLDNYLSPLGGRQVYMVNF